MRARGRARSCVSSAPSDRNDSLRAGARSSRDFLAHARETYAAPLPRYVQEELRGYLRCGVFAHGFVRAHCDGCGHDLLVAFSCKARGVCPSCAGAAHGEHRRALGRSRASRSARAPVGALASIRAAPARGVSMRRCSPRSHVSSPRHSRIGIGKWGSREGLGPSQTGAITFVQRFGSSLNLNVHLHVVVLDGVFVRDATEHPVIPCGAAPFEGASSIMFSSACIDAHPRGSCDMGTSTNHRSKRARTTCRRRRRSTCAPISRCSAEPRRRLRDGGEEEAEQGIGARTAPAHEAARSRRLQSACERAHRGRRRSRSRASLSLRRAPTVFARAISKAAWRSCRLPIQKKRAAGRAKLLVVTPLELLARIAALIPPPRYPLVRLPRRARAALVVAKSGDSASARSRRDPREKRSARTCEERRPHRAARRRPRIRHREATTTPIIYRNGERAPRSPLRIFSVTYLAPNVIAVRHWERLCGGLVFATAPRIPWSILLRRTFEVDVLECAKCHGRLRVLGAVEDPLTARALLEQLGLPTDAPAQPRARDPSTLDGQDPTDDRDE